MSVFGPKIPKNAFFTETVKNRASDCFAKLFGIKIFANLSIFDYFSGYRAKKFGKMTLAHVNVIISAPSKIESSVIAQNNGIFMLFKKVIVGPSEKNDI